MTHIVVEWSGYVAQITILRDGHGFEEPVN